MNILITLDYELFYDKNPNLENSIINPTNEILKIVDPLNVKLILFVDVGYLKCLEKHKSEFPELEKDYQLITLQLKELCDNGHEVQLHIHPHWEDSYYDGKEWYFDLTRYKLTNFSKEEIHNIVTEYTEILHRITQQKLTAFRAGGWSAQPFEVIGDALHKNGILYDTSVYPRGALKSKEQWYDFNITAEIHKNGGRSLLKEYNNFFDLLQTLRPKTNWNFGKFKKSARGLWHNKERQVEYLNWLSDTLGLVGYQDWYDVTSADFEANYGVSLLGLYSASVSECVMTILDEHPWEKIFFIKTNSNVKDAYME